jgi:hypothetical protein
MYICDTPAYIHRDFGAYRNVGGFQTLQSTMNCTSSTLVFARTCAHLTYNGLACLVPMCGSNLRDHSTRSHVVQGKNFPIILVTCAIHSAVQTGIRRANYHPLVVCDLKSFSMHMQALDTLRKALEEKGDLHTRRVIFIPATRSTPEWLLLRVLTACETQFAVTILRWEWGKFATPGKRTAPRLFITILAHSQDTGSWAV